MRTLFCLFLVLCLSSYISCYEQLVNEQLLSQSSLGPALGSAASSSLQMNAIAQALDHAEQQAAAMAWASGSPQQIQLSGDAMHQLQEENEKLLNKDLALMLNTAKTTIQFPVHTRVQPIIQGVPKFPNVHNLPVLNAQPRVEQMSKSRNQLQFQGAISTKQPMLSSKSSLAQAVLSRGMSSAIHQTNVGQLGQVGQQIIQQQQQEQQFRMPYNLGVVGHQWNDQQQFVPQHGLGYAGANVNDLDVISPYMPNNIYNNQRVGISNQQQLQQPIYEYY